MSGYGYKIRRKHDGAEFDVKRLECGDQVVIYEIDGREYGLARSAVDLVFDEEIEKSPDFQAGREAGASEG